MTKKGQCLPQLEVERLEKDGGECNGSSERLSSILTRLSFEPLMAPSHAIP